MFSIPEVDIDANRTWCPKAGCETVCKLCPSERCSPQSVHCPTCTSDFCSNCKQAWHAGLTCEQNTKQLAKEGKVKKELYYVYQHKRYELYFNLYGYK